MDCHWGVGFFLQGGEIVKERCLLHLSLGCDLCDDGRTGIFHLIIYILSAARFGFPAEKMTCIGVTGTKGKTTTTYMIKAILEAAGKKMTPEAAKREDIA